MDEELIDDGPRWLDVPSIQDEPLPRPEPGQMYHDLGALYPDAPIPHNLNDIVIRRAVLHDVTGIEELLDWSADGEMVVVELQGILGRGLEFETVIEKISKFVVGDLGGSLVQLGEERVLILPASVRGVAGIEQESFE